MAAGGHHEQEAQLKQGLADCTAKTAVSKPEVEIRRRPKKSTL